MNEILLLAFLYNNWKFNEAMRDNAPKFQPLPPDLTGVSGASAASISACVAAFCIF
jgi:hypothetical protein